MTTTPTTPTTPTAKTQYELEHEARIVALQQKYDGVFGEGEREAVVASARDVFEAAAAEGGCTVDDLCAMRRGWHRHPSEPYLWRLAAIVACEHRGISQAEVGGVLGCGKTARHYTISAAKARAGELAWRVGAIGERLREGEEHDRAGTGGGPGGE